MSKKKLACLSVVFGALMIATNVSASGNGGGNKPPRSGKGGVKIEICKFAPFACKLATSRSGNGGGNKPPQSAKSGNGGGNKPPM